MLADDGLRLALEASKAVLLTIVDSDRSMEPTLAGGDAVLVVPLAGDPASGDLLVFRQNQDLVVHRYLGPARAPDGAACLRTRGDGRTEFDPPVHRSAVRGKAAAIRRRGVWRSLEGPAPRLYAALVAWHDLAWAGAIHLARPFGLAAIPAAIDRSLLRLAHRVALPLTHRRIAPPGAAVPPVSV